MLNKIDHTDTTKIQYDQPSFSPTLLFSYLMILSRIDFILPIQSKEERSIYLIQSSSFLPTCVASLAHYKGIIYLQGRRPVNQVEEKHQVRLSQRLFLEEFQTHSSSFNLYTASSM